MNSRVVRALAAVVLSAAAVLGTGASAAASGTSGASTGDFTGDGAHDIMVRHQDTGELRVYPHSGTFNGTNTYRPATTINYGWNSLRWIGQGRINADKFADVIAVTYDGTMIVYPHSGTFNGTSTLAPSVVVGTGFQNRDRITVADTNYDGFDDIVARNSTKNPSDGMWWTDSFINQGGINGTSTFSAPWGYVRTYHDNTEQTVADVTLDGKPEFLYIDTTGHLEAYEFSTGRISSLGYGWETISALTLTDIDKDGKVDLLGRRAADGVLQAYVHSGRTNVSFDTFLAPVVVGYQWHINDVIS